MSPEQIAGNSFKDIYYIYLNSLYISERKKTMFILHKSIVSVTQSWLHCIKMVCSMQRVGMRYPKFRKICVRNRDTLDRFVWILSILWAYTNSSCFNNKDNLLNMMFRPTCQALCVSRSLRGCNLLQIGAYTNVSLLRFLRCYNLCRTVSQ